MTDADLLKRFLSLPAGTRKLTFARLVVMNHAKSAGVELAPCQWCVMPEPGQ